MKTIQFLNKKYDIPESWDEVTLKMQMQVSTISHQEKYIKTLGILAGYTGIPVEDLKTAKVNDLERVMKSMTFLQDAIPEEPVMEFSFNGHDYQVATNIIEQQFQDFVAIQTAISNNGETKWLATPYILAVMAKRGEETLDDFDVNARAKEFEDIPISIANGVAAFFLSNSKVSRSITMLSSPEVQKDILHAKVEELNLSLNKLKQQRGGNILIRLWIMTSRRYIKSLRCQLEKSFSSQPSNNSKKKWKQTFRRLRLKMRKEKVENNKGD